jgi:hypothetical protein
MNYAKRNSGRKTRFQPLLWLCFLLLAFSMTKAAVASDADLNAVLLRSGCGSPLIKPLYERDGVKVYEANCFGTSHKKLIVTCVPRKGCQVNRPERDIDPPR